MQLSKDDQLVLMHDNCLDRTTLTSGLVNAFTAKELSSVELKDPWQGVPCYVERLSTALSWVGSRGLVTVDMHHVVPRTVRALERAVDESGFNVQQLLLLSYTPDGGLLYKNEFPGATVLLKSPHNLKPPELELAWIQQAIGAADGVLVPIVGFPAEIEQFRSATKERELKLAVYMHTKSESELHTLFQIGVDFVTSYWPYEFGRVKRGIYPQSRRVQD